MAIEHSYADCSECGFPVSGSLGQAVTCPSCGISGSISGVEIPSPIFWGGLGILVGLILAKSKIVGGKLARL